uniref:Major facilitator superfamily (MFS) profile domain-containing protein n=1 Tax=Pyrodinium bahamense TaxID=73915 RepID=A0A7S0ALW2_9DINO
MSVQAGEGRVGSRLAARDSMVLLVFGCRLVQTVLRMAMGALVVYICEEHSCTPASKGWILSAHAFGYCTTQVLGGVLADRAGGCGVAGGALAAAGLALATTPAAAALLGLGGVVAAQVVMGIAMGPLFPATMQVLAKWLPPNERAFASTALDSGITVGSLVAVPISSALAVHFGWRPALVIYGLAAIAYSALWAKHAAERPDCCPYCSEGEQAFLASALPQTKRQPEAGADADGFLEALRHMRFWAIYVAHFAFNYSVYFINSWSATYYLEVFAMRPEHAGLHLSLPHAVNMLVKVCATPIIARAMRVCSFSDLGCRRAFSGVGFLVAAACLRLLPYAAGSASATTALFSTALGFMGLHPSGFKANYMDVTREHGGVVSGVGNTVASVASSIGPLLVSQVRASSGSWSPVFHSVAMLNLLAILIFGTLSSTTPIEEDCRSPQYTWQELRSKAQLARILGLVQRRAHAGRRHSGLVAPARCHVVHAAAEC